LPILICWARVNGFSGVFSSSENGGKPQSKFDYPSPYWDSVGDPALDLIDRMLTVDVNKRITVPRMLKTLIHRDSLVDIHGKHPVD
jgi:hypothetical protein